MRARIFRKKDEHGADSKPGHCARSESFRPNFSTPIKKAKAIRQSFWVVFDSSLNGLSEEGIFAFHNYGNSSLSSLTSPTGSSGSLYVSHSNFPNRLVTQGPSKFEATELNGTNCNALKMPSRRRGSFMEACHESNNSLSLTDIAEEIIHGQPRIHWARNKSVPFLPYGPFQQWAHLLLSSLTSPRPSFFSTHLLFHITRLPREPTHLLFNRTNGPAKRPLSARSVCAAFSIFVHIDCS